MTATLKFNLPDEDYEFHTAIEGVQWKVIVSDILRHVKDKLKHAELKPNQFEVYEDIETEIVRALQDENLSVW